MDYTRRGSSGCWTDDRLTWKARCALREVSVSRIYCDCIRPRSRGQLRCLCAVSVHLVFCLAVTMCTSRPGILYLQEELKFKKVMGFSTYVSPGKTNA